MAALPAPCAKQLFFVNFRVPYLQAGDAADPEACFAALPALCAKQLVHEDPALVADLLGVMLYAENRCDSARWFSLRYSPAQWFSLRYSPAQWFSLRYSPAQCFSLRYRVC